MSWRCTHFVDPDTETLLEAHITPEPDEADGWDGYEDDRPREFIHWHEPSDDELREFYEVPTDIAARFIAAVGGDHDSMSLHDAMAVLLLRLDA